jgi:transcriptional regulator with XRE-family HTH domain
MVSTSRSTASGATARSRQPAQRGTAKPAGKNATRGDAPVKAAPPPAEAEVEAEDAAGNAGLGWALRELRRTRGLSLAEVAAGTGLSRSFLSLVESEKSDISLGRLQKVTAFYDITFPQLFGQKGSAGDVVRKDEQPVLRFAKNGTQAVMLTRPGRAQQMLPMIVTLEPGGGMLEPARESREEFVHVISGQIEVLMSVGDAPVVLRPGDSAYFDCAQGYRIHNPSKKPASFFEVTTR